VQGWYASIVGNKAGDYEGNEPAHKKQWHKEADVMAKEIGITSLEGFIEEYAIEETLV
jgi:hypothetical protein